MITLYRHVRPINTVVMTVSNLQVSHLTGFVSLLLQNTPVVCPVLRKCWVTPVVCPVLRKCWVTPVVCPVLRKCWVTPVVCPVLRKCWVTTVVCPDLKECWVSTVVCPVLKECWVFLGFFFTKKKLHDMIVLRLYFKFESMEEAAM